MTRVPRSPGRSALRDFGVLTGVQRKLLRRPAVAPEVALHLCRVFDSEGLRGRALLEARDWRLFLCDLYDTSLVLAQLAQRGEIRFNLSYIDKDTRQESFVSCKELGSTKLIPDSPLPPGDVFTVGHDAAEGRYSLFRIQCSVAPGGARFSVVGVTSKGNRESGRMAYDYLRATGKKIGIDRDLGQYDVNVQVMSLSQGKDAADLGMAFYIALLSATLGRTIGAQLVVLGQMSLHGVLSRVDGLGDKLRVAMDAGAQRVLIPTENSRDFAGLPAEVLDKLRIEFYSEPSQAAFKALAE